MKWLLVTEDFPPDFVGGIATWSYAICSMLAEANFEVTAMARKTPNSKRFDARQNFSIVRVWGRSWGKWKHLWSYLATRFQNPDVVVFSTWELAQWAAPVLKSKNCTILVGGHGSEITRPNIPTHRLRKLNHVVDYWLPVSKYLGGLLTNQIPARNVVYPPLPIEIAPKPTPYEADKPLIMVARLTARKGITTGIQIGYILALVLRCMRN